MLTGNSVFSFPCLDVCILWVSCTLAFGVKSMSLAFQDGNGFSAECLIFFHDFVLVLLLPILFLVLLSMFSLLKSRLLWRSLLEGQRAEFLWSLLPLFVLAAIVLPSLSILYLLDEVGTPVLSRHVTGFQWYWSYTLTEESIFTKPSFLSDSSQRCLGTDSSLVLPSGMVFRLLVSSADVLHSWSLPAFGLKADAVPGRLNMLSGILDRAGLYYGQCSEICGSNHSFMPIASEVTAFLNG